MKSPQTLIATNNESDSRRAPKKRPLSSERMEVSEKIDSSKVNATLFIARCIRGTHTGVIFPSTPAGAQLCSDHFPESAKDTTNQAPMTTGGEKGGGSLSGSSPRTAGTASTDSIVSASESSSNDGNRERPRRKVVPSSPCDHSGGGGIEPPKKKARNLFSTKLTLLSLGREAADEEASASNAASNSQTAGIKRSSIEETANSRADVDRPSERMRDGSNRAAVGIVASIQHLLTVRREEEREAQSNMSISQLKDMARRKARERRRKPKRSAQPKRRRTTAGRRRRRRPDKPPAPSAASGNEDERPEPVEVVEMNTGTLHLYRGETRRAKFVRMR